MIPYGKQDITQQDIEAVVAVLKSDFLTQGPAVPAFEDRLQTHCGAKFAVAVNSATSALHIACLALGLGPGDTLWTSPISFVASANCARYCGADVDFVDIDPISYNMSAQALADKLEQAKQRGKLPKIVVPVHLCGQPCEMERIRELSSQYGFKIIEDASHAIGASYKAEPVGNCRYSDITVFSFHPVKIITTAEGGVAVTNDPSLAKKMQTLRSHGITREPALMSQVDGPWYYQQRELGFNYRMTDMQAALGLSQMDRLQDYVSERQRIAEFYDNSLSELPLQLPQQHPDGNSSRHLYVIRVRGGAAERAQLFDELKSRQLGVNVHYIPIHTQPYYQALGFKASDFPQALHYYKQAISLPLFPTMTAEQRQHVVTALSDALRT